MVHSHDSVFRLKLSPDQRRPQSSGILVGMGTIILNQDFRFTVSSHNYFLSVHISPEHFCLQLYLAKPKAFYQAGKLNLSWTPGCSPFFVETFPKCCSWFL